MKNQAFFSKDKKSKMSSATKLFGAFRVKNRSLRYLHHFNCLLVYILLTSKRLHHDAIAAKALRIYFL